MYTFNVRPDFRISSAGGELEPIVRLAVEHPVVVVTKTDHQLFERAVIDPLPDQGWPG